MILLDSHIWFWWINLEHDRFPAQWRGLIEQADRVGVSPVSCYELALARERGRLALNCDPVDWFARALQPAGVELLPVTPAIACRAVALSAVHRDPFDRLIIATALEHGAQLASVDGLIARYPEIANHLLPDSNQADPDRPKD